MTDDAITNTQPAPIDATERAQIITALLQPQATVSPKYFYDLAGSRLFEVITLLDEYYPTVTERAILSRHAREISAAVAPCAQLVELGAGACEKVPLLLPHLTPASYVAVDVSVPFVEAALVPLRRAFPAVSMTALAADIGEPLPLPPPPLAGRRLFFYPGSSIGNFTPEEALALLTRLHAQCAGQGGVLIGVDLVKDTAVLDAAYNDALGVTAAFNLNLLRHLNRLIGSDFDPAQWEHQAFFNAAQSRIEMHLRARCALTVHWDVAGNATLPEARSFAAGETLHTENSVKYTPQAFTALLQQADFTRVRQWTDARDYFGVFAADA